jgi:A/G-specific adenine glycosylase
VPAPRGLHRPAHRPAAGVTGAAPPGAPAATARVHVVALEESGSVLLERRPESGVWGGLWSLPEFTTASAAAAFIRDTLGVLEGVPRQLAALEHAFTHFDLTITPLLVQFTGTTFLVEEGRSLWYNLHEPARIGLPAPVSTLLVRLSDETLFDRRP